MNKNLTLILILLISTATYSQDNKNRIGITFSNNYSRSERLDLLNGRRLRATYKNGFGVNGNFEFAKNWQFEIGWMYSFRGNSTDKVKTNFRTSVPNDPAIPSHLKYQEKFEFIDIPIKFLKKINTKEKSNQFVSLGLVPTFVINYKITQVLYYNDNAKTTDFFPLKNFRDLNAMFLLGYGYNINLSKSVSLQLELNAKRTILNIHTEESKKSNQI